LQSGRRRVHDLLRWKIRAGVHGAPSLSPVDQHEAHPGGLFLSRIRADNLRSLSVSIDSIAAGTHTHQVLAAWAYVNCDDRLNQTFAILLTGWSSRWW